MSQKRTADNKRHSIHSFFVNFASVLYNADYVSFCFILFFFTGRDKGWGMVSALTAYLCFFRKHLYTSFDGVTYIINQLLSWAGAHDCYVLCSLKIHFYRSCPKEMLIIYYDICGFLKLVHLLFDSILSEGGWLPFSLEPQPLFIY